MECLEGETLSALLEHKFLALPEALTMALQVGDALDRVIRKCLAKNPEDRWQTTRDLVSELRWIVESGGQAGVPVVPTVQRRIRLLWAAVAIGGLALAAALGVIWTRAREAPALRPPVRFTVAPPAPYAINIGAPALSPDGKPIAYVSTESRRHAATAATAVLQWPRRSVMASWIAGYATRQQPRRSVTLDPCAEATRDSRVGAMATSGM